MATLERQIRLSTDMLQNYEDLLQAENEKFRIGESSVFLLNSREQKLIAARKKWLKQKAEYEKARAGRLWAAGQL